MDTRVLIDMDGTVVDLMGHAHALGLLYHPMCRWDFPGCCSPFTMDGLFANNALFRDAPPIEAAVASVCSLISQGFDVRFVSTPWHSNHETARVKYEWIEKYFGDPKLLTLTHDKALIPARVLVDDKPNLRGPWHHITYPQPWNESNYPSWSDGLVDHVIASASSKVA